MIRKPGPATGLTGCCIVSSSGKNGCMFSLRPYLGLTVPYKITWQASSTMSLSGTEVVDTLGKRLEDIVDIHSVMQRTSDTQLKHAI